MKAIVTNIIHQPIQIEDRQHDEPRIGVDHNKS